jgi:hypothetical protein
MGEVGFEVYESCAERLGLRINLSIEAQRGQLNSEHHHLKRREVFLIGLYQVSDR